MTPLTNITKIKYKASEKPKEEKLKINLFGIGEERNYFVDNLTMLLASGMDIVVALDAIRQGLRSNRMKKVIDFLKIELDKGATISEALAKTNLLPPHVISLIRIGEESGRLPENLKVVVLQQEKDRLFKSRIRSAMMYPTLVLIIAVVVGIGVAWFVLPKLTTVFTTMNLALPTPTKILLAIGNLLSKKGIIIVPSALFIFGILFYLTFFHPKTKVVGQFLISHLPIIKNVIAEIEIARFGFILGTLIESGMPIAECLSSLEQAMNYPGYRALARHLRENIVEGKSFEESFKLYPKSKKYLPVTLQQMISFAERSGKLGKTLLSIGAMYETKNEISTKNLSVILEPLLLVVVWLAVIGIALAVIMPIYNLLGGVSKL